MYYYFTIQGKYPARIQRFRVVGSHGVIGMNARNLKNGVASGKLPAGLLVLTSAHCPR